MESFFLSETAKYLYLLHSNASALADFYIFSTEGHILPVLPSEEPSHDQSGSQPDEAESKHGNCRDLCRIRSRPESLQVLRALPLSTLCQSSALPSQSCSLLHRPIPIKHGMTACDSAPLVFAHRLQCTRADGYTAYGVAAVRLRLVPWSV